MCNDIMNLYTDIKSNLSNNNLDTYDSVCLYGESDILDVSTYEAIFAQFQLISVIDMISDKDNKYAESVGAIIGGVVAVISKIVMLFMKILIGVKGIILGALLGLVMYFIKKAKSGSKTAYSGGGGGGSSKPAINLDNLVNMGSTKPANQLGTSGVILKNNIIKDMKNDKSEDAKVDANLVKATESIATEIKKKNEEINADNIKPEVVNEIIDYAMKDFRFDTDEYHHVFIVKKEYVDIVEKRLKDIKNHPETILNDGKNSVSEYFKSKPLYDVDNSMNIYADWGIRYIRSDDRNMKGVFDIHKVIIQNIDIFIFFAVTLQTIGMGYAYEKIDKSKQEEILKDFMKNLENMPGLSAYYVNQFKENGSFTEYSAFEMFKELLKKNSKIDFYGREKFNVYAFLADFAFDNRDRFKKINNALRVIKNNYISYTVRDFPNNPDYAEFILYDSNSWYCFELLKDFKLKFEKFDELKKSLECVEKISKNNLSIMESSEELSNDNHAVELVRNSATLISGMMNIILLYSKVLASSKGEIYNILYKDIAVEITKNVKDAIIENIKKGE
ncbi:hypothetical protein JDFnp1_53 [Fusobacterium phage JD-Fnp1]|nr:hypothetical protein JDFnp1_53 [Fusobacterium phage JD-Fnp1]